MDHGLGDFALIAVLVSDGHIALIQHCIAVAIVHRGVGNINGCGSLSDGDSEGSLAGLIIVVTGKLEGQLIFGNAIALIGIGIGDVQAGNIRADLRAAGICCIGSNQSPKILVGIVLIHDGHIVALHIAGQTGIPQIDGGFALDVVCILTVGNLDFFGHGLSLGSIVAEVVCAIVGSRIGNFCQERTDAANTVLIPCCLDAILGQILLDSLVKRHGVLDHFAGLHIDIQPQSRQLQIECTQTGSIQQCVYCAAQT